MSLPCLSNGNRLRVEPEEVLERLCPSSNPASARVSFRQFRAGFLAFVESSASPVESSASLQDEPSGTVRPAEFKGVCKHGSFLSHGAKYLGESSRTNSPIAIATDAIDAAHGCLEAVSPESIPSVLIPSGCQPSSLHNSLR